MEKKQKEVSERPSINVFPLEERLPAKFISGIYQELFRSMHSPCKGTSARSGYGADTELVRSSRTPDRASEGIVLPVKLADGFLLQRKHEALFLQIRIYFSNILLLLSVNRLFTKASKQYG